MCIGMDMKVLWGKLGLLEEMKQVRKNIQVQIYNEYMAKLNLQCVADLNELFLEQMDLFNKICYSPMGEVHVHLSLKVYITLNLQNCAHSPLIVGVWAIK